jgi:hypothetical protein
MPNFLMLIRALVLSACLAPLDGEAKWAENSDPEVSSGALNSSNIERLLLLRWAV